jgi:DNA-binding transcriptional MerR regulator/effector-binding domain-containing protein
VEVATLLTIGDFSRMTYLSVKALRHYHETGLLSPADVDPASGYRLYDAAQVATGQAIRRFRELGMPLDQVRAVLDAPDLAARNEIVVAHLARMEAELERTQATVASLRALLEQTGAPVPVEHRSAPPVPALGIVEPLALSEFKGWWADAFAELDHAVRAGGLVPAGPAGALFADEVFAEERGEAVAFVPLAGGARGRSGRVQRLVVPGADLAVAVHEGSFADVDRTYGALGTYVAERGVGVPGPIREYYLVGADDTPDESQHRTDVCWPVATNAA